MINQYKLYPLGDKGITIVLGDEINLKTHQKVKQIFQKLSKVSHEAIIELVPTYTNVTVYYNHKKASFTDMSILLESFLDDDDDDECVGDSKVIEIPVCYGGAYGPDLARVASHNQLSEEEVIQKHAAEKYLIYMMGFLPGFPYLGGLSTSLATPRLASPRQAVKAGSVGIAGNQTGIYPLESPGGWNIIGQTPVAIYRPKNQQPFLFEVGMYIQFKPITPDDFKRIQES